MKLGVVGGVNHELIHGDGPHLGQPVPPMEHTHTAREKPWHAIGITNGHHRQPAGAFCVIAVVIADAGASGDGFEDGDLARTAMAGRRGRMPSRCSAGAWP